MACPQRPGSSSTTSSTTITSTTAASDRQWLIALTLINAAILLVMIGKGGRA